MNRPGRTAAVALVALLGCDGPMEGPQDVGYVALQISVDSGARAGFATGRVIIDGPTTVERTIQSGTDTINGLRPGSYTVGLESLDLSGAVESFGSSSAQVRSNQLTTVSVTLSAFPAGSLEPTVPATANQAVTVTVDAIPGASTYEWQWDTDAGFASPESQETGTSIQLTLATSHFVRVRGLNQFGGPSAWSNASLVAVDGDSPIELSVTSVSFASPQGGERGNGLIPIQRRSIEINNTGTATINWQALDAVPWLEVDPPNGSLFAGRSETIEIVKNRVSGILRTGSYQEIITFTDGSGATNLTVNHSVTAGPPAVPDQFTFQEVTPAVVTITWRDNSNDEEWFQIEEGDNFAAWQKIGTVNPGVTTFSDTDVRSGLLLRYRVRACNSAFGPCEDPLNNDGGPNAAHDQSSVIAARNAEGRLVRASNGAGVGGVQVTLQQCASWGSVSSPPAAGTCTTYVGGTSPTVTSDAEGRFVFEDLGEGVYEVQVNAGSGGFNSSTPATAVYDLRQNPKDSRDYQLN